MKTKTLKDVADALNISITTVSKALNNYPDISAATRKKVLDYAQSIDFTPNTFATSLRKQESKIVGIIIPKLAHYFFSMLLQGIIEKAEEHNYLVIVLKSNSYELEKIHIRRLLKQKVDGIFLSLAQDSHDVSHLEEIWKSGTVLIQYDRVSKIAKSSKIVINDRGAASQAVQHLIDSGKKKIAHLRGGLLPQVAIDRFIGYRKTLEKNGIEYQSDYVEICEKGNENQGYEAAKKLWARHPDIDGIFAHTDMTALGAIKFLKEQKIRIPDQVGVVGFSNWNLTTLTSPSLTTINQPGKKMGKAIFTQFLKDLKALKAKENIDYNTTVIKTSLIKRESS